MSELLARSRLMRLTQSVEALFTSPYGFRVETATDVQRSIARVLSGEPCIDSPETRQAFGGCLPTKSPKEMCVLSGVRGGKTALACAAAIHSTQHVRLDIGSGKNMLPGEVPRVSIVSARTDLAEAAFGYIRGAVLASEPLKGLLYEDPTSDSIVLKHPSGTPIEIKVVAASRAGVTLVARWSAGVIFDEAPRMASEQEGYSVSLKEMIRNIRSRMLDGAPILYIGSPWGQTGDVYDMVAAYEGKQDPPIQIVRATGPMMNPVHWTPERCEELRVLDPDSHKTDVLAEFRDPETALLAAASVDACTRGEPLVIEPEDGGVYTAFMDPGTRGNSWTFGIADTRDNMRFRVCLVLEWTGSKSEPLSPKAVFEEMKPYLERYAVGTVLTDQYAADALRDIARDLGISVSPITITPALKLQMYESMRVRFDGGMLEIPGVPQLRTDLLGCKKRVTSNGLKIVLPETADGRHCDYAAMIALLCGQYLAVTAPPVVEPLDEPGDESSFIPREWWEENERQEQLMEQGANW